MILTNKEKQSCEMPMLKSNYFDQIRPESDRIDGDRAAPCGKVRRSTKNGTVERPKSLAGVPCSPAAAARLKELNESSPFGAFASEPRDEKGVCDKPSAGQDLPEDLCDMFCTLLLEPEETMPIEVSVKIVLVVVPVIVVCLPQYL